MQDERAFLARTVWRVGLDRLGTASARAMRHAEDVTELNLHSPADNPEQNALASADRARMKLLVDALPEDLRRPLVLAAVEGMTSREVADLLGIPEGTVRTRIMRAKAELRRRFLTANPNPGGGPRMNPLTNLQLDHLIDDVVAEIANPAAPAHLERRLKQRSLPMNLDPRHRSPQQCPRLPFPRTHRRPRPLPLLPRL